MMGATYKIHLRSAVANEVAAAAAACGLSPDKYLEQLAENVLAERRMGRVEALRKNRVGPYSRRSPPP